MPLIVVLAHGALGPFDEIIFLSVAIIFVVMMVINWFRSQQLEDEIEGNDSSTDDRIVTRDFTQSERFELE